VLMSTNFKKIQILENRKMTIGDINIKLEIKH
jgi:hypothetical protein